ncbi:MAG TPA: hypothetical protein VGO89_08425, partial [Streptomyces sp.]|nr:hypothetical protein [Streptomyces sp.]
MTHRLISAADQGTGISHISLPISGGGLLLLAVVAYAVFSGGDKHHNRGHRQKGDYPDKELFEAIIGFLKVTWTVLRFLLRFLSGRELHGERRSDAGFLRAGRRRQTDTTAPLPVSQLGSVGAPTVSLVKPRRPRPWAAKAARAIRGYSGPGARALTGAGAVALWIARWTRKAVRAIKAVCDALKPLVRLLAAWGRWPYAARSLARMALVAAIVGLAVPAWRAWTIVGLAVSVLALVAISLRWKPKEPGDDERYGPAVWALLRVDLKLPEDEPREGWLHLPERLAAPDARIVVQLPWTFRGSET